MSGLGENTLDGMTSDSRKRKPLPCDTPGPGYTLFIFYNYYGILFIEYLMKKLVCKAKMCINITVSVSG